MTSLGYRGVFLACAVLAAAALVTVGAVDRVHRRTKPVDVAAATSR